MDSKIINAIERIIDKRSLNGASDQNLINWLEGMKNGIWEIDSHAITVLDGFIDAIRQTPLIK